MTSTSSWVHRKMSGLGLRLFHAKAAPTIQTIMEHTVVGSPQVQELDDGFFEKFGTLLGETQRADDVATCSVARSHQLGAAPMAACSVAEAVSGEDAAADPGKDPTLADALGEAVGGLQVDGTARMDQSDSETEEAVKQENISDFVGMNVEELYSEVLYLLIHNVGSDVTTASDRSDLCRLLQEAFKIDDEKHAQLMGNVEAKEAPKIVLNVEVMEAQDLKPKDSNGMCDPFCTLYLSSAPTHRYNTSVKTETLTPCWMEYFSLPVHNATDDVLFVEVWDFDPAETVREKMSKLTDVKGVRGLRKLVKEIAVTASTGKHDNEYIGTAQINLNCIATGGQTQWVNLEKKNKTKKQGVIKLHMAFGAEKDTQVARQEHRHLLRLLLMHHLEKAKLEPYAWCGEFDELATTIIRQHAVQSGLSSTDETLARWMEFCSVHVDHPLSFALFSQLANKLKKPLEEGNLSPEEVKHFWDATKKFLPSCLNSIRRLRKLSNCDRNTLTQLSGIVTTLSCLKPLPVPEGLDLFPSSVYGWLNQSDQSSCDISHVLTEAVKHGAEDWLCYVLENNTADGPTQEDSLRHVIKLVQLVRSDLTKAIEYHDKIFLKGIGLAYSSILYKVYEEKVCEEAEPVVKDVCGQLRPIRINDSDPRINLEREEPLSMGTTLFELYLALQRLSLIGSTLCPNDVDSFQIAKFHNWFYHGVAQWLDIACYKAVQRVKKAVELDTLVPVDSSVKYSSSAVDTFAIFYQIKIFWQQLAWPDVEGSYTFVLKIIDDICKCSEVYADNMSQKVDGMGETNQGTVHEKKFQVTQEWCLAINNIDYVRQSIQPFVAELGMDNIVKALADFRSVAAAEQCKGTLSGIIENSIDVVRNKIIDLLLIVANKMDPAIKRFLQEGADLLNQDSNAVDRLMQYLDENLVMLHSELNTENFERILSIMWDNVSNILSELVESSLEKRKPPSFFSNLHETLNILIGFFRQGDLQQQLQEQQQIEQLNGMKQVQNDDVIDSSVDKHSKLRRVERILRLHGMETPELSYQFYVQRLMEQKKLQSMGDAPYQGLLTIRAQFVDNALSIEIMNARNIKPMDSNGSCDPYVKIHLVPEDKFVNVQKPRTKTHKKNLFPLFDETFHIPLTPEQRARGIIAFILKDQDFLGNEFIAEAFHSFEDIPENDASTSLQTLPQVHLKLHRPQNVLESDVMKALEHRQGDKLARDFVKRQKAKFGEGKQQNGSK
ncbi:protein unc-13 homolog 4B isoform X2 [Thrips palmi]|uniref:Protein unc-13 homolog 4B isoform X2 n=1 Tax=Thrips palmi TaxID=161013 RepID=A0A6P8ZPF3_THRPL|nr:protein unc-13 homolog 4B isoform X2 [Thrips palmi]